MNKTITKLVTGGLVMATIGTSCYYLGANNSPPTVVRTEIVQTKEGKVEVNYKEIIAEGLLDIYDPNEIITIKWEV